MSKIELGVCDYVYLFFITVLQMYYYLVCGSISHPDLRGLQAGKLVERIRSTANMWAVGASMGPALSFDGE